MLRSSSVPVPLRVLALLIVVSALVLATLAPVLADQHPAANDGQRLEDQPADVQATYRAVYGADAEARWIADHNAAIDAMMMAPMGDSDPMSNMYYDRIVAVAIARGAGAMDMDLPHRIAVDVISRGTEMAFLEGTDTGVVYGVGTSESDISMPPAAAPAASSGGGGTSTTTSPPTSDLSEWKNASVAYFVGTEVSLTLPKSTLATVDGYTLTPTDQIPAGLTFDGKTSTLSGTPTTATAADGVALTYAATDGGTAVGAPYSMVLTVRINLRDDQPSFGNASVDSITIFDGQAITDGRSTALPEVVDGSGNEPIVYTLDGAPEEVSLGDTRVLAGTPTKVGTYSVMYIATDNDGDTDKLSFDIVVEADTAPELPAVADVTVKEGQAWTLKLPDATGGNGTLTYTLTDITVLGLQTSDFNASTRYVVGTIGTGILDDNDDSETFTLTYRVNDSYAKGAAENDSDEVTFKVTVTAAT